MEHIEFEGKDGKIHNITELEDQIERAKELKILNTGTKNLKKGKGYDFKIDDNPLNQQTGAINIIVNEETN